MGFHRCPIVLAVGWLLVWPLFTDAATDVVVKQDDVPLRVECSGHAREVARLSKGQTLRLRFSIATGNSGCYSVSAEMDGSTVRGYVSKDAVTGAEDFEKTRRAASADTHVLVSVISSRLPEPTGTGSKAPPRSGRPAQGGLLGQPAANFTLSDLSRRSYSLGSLRGRVVMLNFWATWCGPCREDMPQLQALHQELSPRGLVLLGVNSESPDRAGDFLRQNQYTFPNLVDEGGRVADQYQVGAIPTAVIIDRQGRIASYLVGLHSQRTLRAALGRAGLPL